MKLTTHILLVPRLRMREDICLQGMDRDFIFLSFFFWWFWGGGHKIKIILIHFNLQWVNRLLTITAQVLSMSICNLYNPLCLSILADDQVFSLNVFTNYTFNHIHTSEPNESMRQSARSVFTGWFSVFMKQPVNHYSTCSNMSISKWFREQGQEDQHLSK